MNIVLGIADGRIPIWEYLNVDIMANQLTIYSNSLLRNLVTNKRKLPSRLWVDSGGYQIMVKGIKLSINEVIKRYSELDADYLMSLDVPIISDEFNEYYFKLNLSNYLALRDALPDKLIIPIVHFYPSKYLIKALEFYVLKLETPIIAYGGIVPPLIKRTGLRFRSLVGIILIKKLLNKWGIGTKLHVLGVGSYLMIRIAEHLEVDSVDTSTWRVKAAYGHVIVPGIGERYVGSREIRYKTPRIREHELNLLYDSLRATKFPLIHKFNELLRSFKGRALINAWVITKTNNGVSPRSSFSKLLMKLLKLLDSDVQKITEVYDGNTL